ncbi:protein unc-50 homolog isoform X2 [Tribolium castaneum]|uniref:Protein unc-50 homolog-like Protein n=1 Tax=Tribolium castaneum TaxID=7070 RepID=D6W8C1_TRICA|nr:PREDICTED: protein unc-50 homolog [Tribolium castaneum]EFA10930.1 Protein unc-50 homolog-like Protein [Tribolium castaneum]|eukprot:XP_969730.1 PREDICTED: protein unc-50 homolog [Tribolium castaneum]
MNSPLPPPTTQRDCMSAATKRYKYLRRMFKFDQMDFEFAFWQMLYLFIAPQKVYRNFRYRKQTKSQFARDDPAFLVLFAAWLCITSVGFAIVLKLGFGQFVYFLLYVIFVDCIAVGVITATFFWYVLNKYFRPSTEVQDVEWGYSFDVHLNAFFPPLILLHFFQLFFYNGLISHEWFISRLLGNTFWLVAVLYYMFITFLGYSSLQILNRTHLILTPVPIVLVFYIISLVAGLNITHVLMTFYKHRVL